MRHDALMRTGIFDEDGKSTWKPTDAKERVDSSPSREAYYAFNAFMETYEEYLPCIDVAIKEVQKGSTEGMEVSRNCAQSTPGILRRSPAPTSQHVCLPTLPG